MVERERENILPEFPCASSGTAKFYGGERQIIIDVLPKFACANSGITKDIGRERHHIA
jgi:hypothetical protein